MMNLYRYIPLETFIDIVINSKLTFLSPSLWEDSFEGWFLKNIPDNFTSTNQLAEKVFSSVYAQCWSLNKDSVALWSIYSYDNHAIMLETIDDEVNKLDDIILKKIEYSEDASLNIDDLANALNSKDIKAWLFPFENKRTAFIHEREVRLFKIYDNESSSIKCINVNIPDVTTFIRGVMVHPFAQDWYVDIIKSVCDKFHIPFYGKSRIYELED